MKPKWFRAWSNYARFNLMNTLSVTGTGLATASIYIDKDSSNNVLDTTNTVNTMNTQNTKTISKAPNFGNENYTNYESAEFSPTQIYDNLLPLDTTLYSNYDDCFNKVDLIFTQSVEDKNKESFQCRMERLVRATQDQVCYEIEKLENGAKFTSDLWKSATNQYEMPCKHNGGLTKVLSNGKVFEKAGVSVSISSGKLPSSAVQQMTADHTKLTKLLKENKLGDENGNVYYFASSVSSVIHPWNPHAPTGHFNYRYFELGDMIDGKFVPKLWWFGGGGDLSPSILYEEDCKHFHSALKSACDRHDPSYYTKFKKWCDDYFMISHRKERRGIGGIFFDDLSNEHDEHDEHDKEQKEKLFNFVKDCASQWCYAYIPLVKRHCFQKYTKAEKAWQQIRRGRYVEFNLVYDRGTKFGLMKPSARIESILMSLPLTSRWEYCREPIFDFEKQVYDVFVNPREWV